MIEIEKNKKRKKRKKRDITKRKYRDNESNVVIYNNNCTSILAKMEPNSINAIVTDPPYGIKFLNEKWDYNVPTTRTFKYMYRVLKPGGTIMCFASPRTQHRMAINIEDAGFELKDCIMWLFGSGFPKSQKMSDLIKKSGKALKSKTETIETEEGKKRLLELIDKFEGYNTHALKPAYEPIIVGMKPLDGNYAENAIKHGIGGLNIDECRLEDKGKKWEKPRGGIWKTDSSQKAILVDNEVGRFPTNLIYEDNDDVRDALDKSVDPTMNIGNGFLSRIFYCAKVKGKSKENNNHPTIKPLSLMEYLCKLVKSPSNGSNGSKDCVILDPFMGSGTTGVACINQGIGFIGIEKECDYFNTARNRVSGAIEAIKEPEEPEEPEAKITDTDNDTDNDNA